MPTSNDTRVRVDGFWKIIPSERPGKSGVGSPVAYAALRLSARSSVVSHSSLDQSLTLVKLRPRKPLGTSIMPRSYVARSGFPLQLPS